MSTSAKTPGYGVPAFNGTVAQLMALHGNHEHLSTHCWMLFNDRIDRQAEDAHAEIKRMVESANRSIGQNFRYLRERIQARIAREQVTLPELQHELNLQRSKLLWHLSTK